MINKKLHIVSFDVPYPADYGGVIDIFYRLKTLHQLGIEITLHVFEYGRKRDPELDKYAKVIYYRRKRSLLHLFSSRPFIVQSRKSKKLLKTLLKDNNPILFEGIHTSWYLEHPQIQSRLTFVRTHNIEHEYYRGLKKNSSFFKFFFFRLEEYKLKKYQTILAKSRHILAINSEDKAHFSSFCKSVFLLPPSVPDIPGSFTIVKRYGLYHGNLSVPENEKAALWIIKVLENVHDQSFPLVIAGKNPGKGLKKVCFNAGVELIANPNDKELERLIQEAQVHLLYTPISSGVKLKLLACINSSGHLLVNNNMIFGLHKEPFFTVADTAKEFKMHFIGMQNSVVEKEEYEIRSTFIHDKFNNEKNCRLIIELMKD